MSEVRSGARAARETLLAELFADVDALLQRVEDLPAAIDAAGARMDAAAGSVSNRCDQLTALTTDLRNATRDDLNALLRRRVDEASDIASARAAEAIGTVVRVSLDEALHKQSQQLAVRQAREQANSRLMLTFSTLCTAVSVASAVWALLGR